MLKFFSTVDKSNNAVSVMLTSKFSKKITIVEVSKPTDLGKLIQWANSKDMEWEFDSDLDWTQQVVKNINEGIIYE